MIDDEKVRDRVINCPLPDALEAMGERWSFLILRGAFNGLQHFEQFQATLGIARNILANRLARLVAHDILMRTPSAEDRRKVEYRLTEKGAALLPTLIALRQWGERWSGKGPVNPMLVDARDGRPVTVVVRAEDGRILSRDDLQWVYRAELASDEEAGARAA